MILGLLNSEVAEKVMLYLANYSEGYPLEIAKNFDLSVSQVQRQLEKFERGGILVSRLIGRTRLYEWNPRYRYKDELQQLFNKALSDLPEKVTKQYFRKRNRRSMENYI